MSLVQAWVGFGLMMSWMNRKAPSDTIVSPFMPREIQPRYFSSLEGG